LLFAIKLTSDLLQGSNINKFEENYSRMFCPFCWSCIQRKPCCPP